MATTQTKVTLAPNLPVRMQVRYVDVFENDLTKNGGKGYGASVRLKGTVNGEDAVCYPKGAAWAVLKALQAGGVVAPGEYDDDPAEKYSIPVANGDATLVLEHLPGDKYSNFKATAALYGAPASAPPANGKAPVSIGGPLPYEAEPGPERAVEAAHVADSARQRQATQPAPSPNAAGPATARPTFAAMAAQYAECFTVALQHAQEAQAIADVAIDLQGLSAIAATLYIARRDRGV